MKGEPKVTVVIPTMCKKVLKRAINSVAQQTYRNLEVIVVNDNPERDTELDEGVEEKIDIEKIHHEYNMGPSIARNSGILNAKGEYIAFLDEDDVWAKTKLEKELEIDKDVVYCGGKWVNSKETIMKKSPEPVDYEKLIRDNTSSLTPSSVIVKRECFRKVGLFDPTMHFCEDWDMWIRLAQKYEFGYVDEILVTQDKAVGSGRESATLSKLSGKLKIMERYGGDLPFFSEQRKKLLILLRLIKRLL